MSWKLYLDDKRSPLEQGFIIARNNNEAIKLVQENGMPIHVAFDYLLEDESTTDYFAYWIHQQVKKGNLLPEGFTYSVHTAFLEGKQIIQKYMNEKVIPTNNEMRLNPSN